MRQVFGQKTFHKWIKQGNIFTRLSSWWVTIGKYVLLPLIAFISLDLGILCLDPFLTDNKSMAQKNRDSKELHPSYLTFACNLLQAKLWETDVLVLSLGGTCLKSLKYKILLSVKTWRAYFMKLLSNKTNANPQHVGYKRLSIFVE